MESIYAQAYRLDKDIFQRYTRLLDSTSDSLALRPTDTFLTGGVR